LKFEIEKTTRFWFPICNLKTAFLRSRRELSESVFKLQIGKQKRGSFFNLKLFRLDLFDLLTMSIVMLIAIMVMIYHNDNNICDNNSNNGAAFGGAHRALPRPVGLLRLLSQI